MVTHQVQVTAASSPIQREKCLGDGDHILVFACTKEHLRLFASGSRHPFPDGW